MKPEEINAPEEVRLAAGWMQVGVLISEHWRREPLMYRMLDYGEVEFWAAHGWELAPGPAGLVHFSSGHYYVWMRKK